MRKFQADLGWKKPLVVLAITLLVVVQFVAAQNLGNSPQFNVAVQGETGAQPEGKHVDEFNEEGEAEGETIIRKRERFSHELTLAYESGQIVELKETKQNKPCREAG